VNPADLVPLIAGPAGALFALLVGYGLLLVGKLVTGREYEKLEAENKKLHEVNDTLRETLRMSQEQNTQLTNSTQVTIQLMKVLDAFAKERRGP
jgi:hypothetical protein